MNSETGEIKRFEKGEIIPDNFISIKEEQMTEKQKETMQVSKHDSKSELGQAMILNRATRRNMLKEQKRRNRNKKR